MNDTAARPGRLAAITDALRAAGFADTDPDPHAAAAALLTAATPRASVLVRIVPQHASSRLITGIHVTCRQHRSCGWRTYLGDDVPAQVIGITASAALSTPLSCEIRFPGV